MKKITIKTSVAAAFLFAALHTQAQTTPGFTDLGMPPGISFHSFVYKNDIAVDNENNVWIGTRGVTATLPGVLAKWSQGNWEVFTSENSELPADTVYSLFPYENKLYIGTSQGLAIYDGGWEVITVDNGLASNHVRAILVNESAVIAGTNQGLSVYADNVWTIHDTLNSGICNNHITALASEENGKLWIGTENGLSSFFEGVWTTYNSENSQLSTPTVRALLLDDHNNLWIGTEGGGGLFKKVDQNFYSFFELFHLQENATNTLLSLTKDNSGNLYAAMRFGSQNRYQFLKINNDRIAAYVSQFTGASSPLLVFHNGLLWFGNTLLPRNLYTFDMSQGRMFDAVNRIDINNISADFTSSGRIGWNIDLHVKPQFEIPKGSGTYTLFTQVPWIGGIANDYSLHFAGERFNQIGRDYWFGPVSADSSVYQQEQEKWNRVWRLSKTEIDHHKNNWNIPGYHTPEVIENWPAHGDISLGQEWFIAPFVDLNNNGIYEPHLGEYPRIRGDQALYLIFNDHRGIHTETGGNILGVEIRAMAYAFDNPSDSALHHSLFINYQAINRSELTYNWLYFGFFTDFDIGYHLDDYIGSDTSLQAYYGYNALPIDGTGGPLTYGEHPPSQGVTFLNQPLSTFTFFNNTSDLPWFMSDPYYAHEYYNYMDAYWKDGTPMIYGGMGHPLTGGFGERVWHMFPGNINNPGDWHEISALNPPNDRRGLGSTNIGTFEPGQRICFDKAFVFGLDYQGDYISSVAVMKERIQQIRDFYSQNFADDCSDLLLTHIPEIKPTASTLPKCYPNPVSKILTIDYSPFSSHASYRLFNAMGALLMAAPVNNAITRIDAGQFNPGLYILIVEDGGRLHHQKIIVH